MKLVGGTGLNQLDEELCIISGRRHETTCGRVTRRIEGCRLVEWLRLAVFSVRSGEGLCKLLTPDVTTRGQVKWPQESSLHEVGYVGGAKSYPTFKLAAATIVHMTREMCDDRLQIAIRFTGV